MIRGTTPDFILEIENYDLTGMTVYVTISQGFVKLTKTNADLDISISEGNSVIGLSLTQQDTLALRVGSADVRAETGKTQQV